MNLRLRLILLGAFLTSFSPIFAQKITGTVTSASGPVFAANVIATPIGKGTSTNIDGKYTLTLKAGSFKVTYSALGLTKKP